MTRGLWTPDFGRGEGGEYLAMAYTSAQHTHTQSAANVSHNQIKLLLLSMAVFASLGQAMYIFSKITT